MGLTDAARRQDQVLVVDDDKELAAIVAKEGNRRQGQGQGAGQGPRSGQRGNRRQSPPRRRSRSRSPRKSPRRDERPRDRRESRNATSGVCDACGGFSHYAKDCRMPRRSRKGRRGQVTLYFCYSFLSLSFLFLAPENTFLSSYNSIKSFPVIDVVRIPIYRMPRSRQLPRLQKL
jgi:hypothetical protein